MRKYNAVESKALFTAAKTGNVAQLEIAIQNGADPNFTNRADDGSPFPLHETAKINDHTKGVACAKILLDHGADTSTRILTTKNTPLHEAASSGREEICRLIIERNQISGEEMAENSNAYGNTPLHTAVRAGNVDIVRLLLEKDFNINAKNNLGSTTLHLCAFLAVSTDKGQEEVCDEGNSSREGICGNTKTLSVQPHLQVAAILLSNKRFKMLDEKDNNGHTPLHIASQRGCNEMVKLLFDSGASLSIKTDVDLKGRGGRTAKEMAQIAGKKTTYSLLEEIENMKEETSFASGTLASDIQTGYSISNPIVGAGGAGLRRKSNYLDN